MTSLRLWMAALLLGHLSAEISASEDYSDNDLDDLDEGDDLEDDDAGGSTSGGPTPFDKPAEPTLDDGNFMKGVKIIYKDAPEPVIRQNETDEAKIASVFLHTDNFDKVVYGSKKTVFVLYGAHNCNACDNMKPDWEQLARTFKGSPNIIIAWAECMEYKDLCKAHGVDSYPRAIYYNEKTGRDGEAYEGSDEYKFMKLFVEEKLDGKIAGASICNVASKEGCSDEEVVILKEYESKEYRDLKKKVKELNAQLSETMKTSQRQEVNSRYQVLRKLAKFKEKEETKARKAIKAASKAAGKLPEKTEEL